MSRLEELQAAIKEHKEVISNLIETKDAVLEKRQEVGY